MKRSNHDVIYHVQQLNYPASVEEWDSYDGILLPRSFLAAYDNEVWIEKSMEDLHWAFALVIRYLPTPFFLMARLSTVLRVGQKSFSFSEEGSSLFLNRKNNTVDLYYMHGEMAQKLPKCAISLGGTDAVPIQVAAYFHS